METALTTVCVACSLPIFRVGLRQVLHATVDIHIVAEASDSDEAIRALEETHPTVLIAEVELPGGGATALLRRLDQLGLAPATVLIARDDSHELGTLELSHHTSLLLNNDDDGEFQRSVRAAARGKQYISKLAQLLLLKRRRIVPTESDTSTDVLTPTEIMVLGYLEDGGTSRQIAEHLFISYRTVQKHRANIARKLGLAGSNALLTFAVQRKRV